MKAGLHHKGQLSFKAMVYRYHTPRLQCQFFTQIFNIKVSILAELVVELVLAILLNSVFEFCFYVNTTKL